MRTFLTTPMAHMARMTDMALTCGNGQAGG